MSLGEKSKNPVGACLDTRGLRVRVGCLIGKSHSRIGEFAESGDSKAAGDCDKATGEAAVNVLGGLSGVTRSMVRRTFGGAFFLLPLRLRTGWTAGGSQSSTGDCEDSGERSVKGDGETTDGESNISVGAHGAASDRASSSKRRWAREAGLNWV